MSSKKDYLEEGPAFENNPAEINKNKDGLKPDNTDLKRTTKKTLKDYLSDKSSINQFPVDKNHDENKPDISIYGDSEGKKSPELIVDFPNANEYQFKPQFLQKQPSKIENFKPGKLISNENELNGNNLIQQSGKPSKELSAYNKTLLRSNRFDDENSYGSRIGDKTFSIKKIMKSSYDEQNENLKFIESKINPINLSVEQMNEIGNYLMLRASGKSARPDTGELFIPGVQQLVPGTKVPGRDLNVQELVKDIFIDDPNEKELMGNPIGQFRDSFGVLNNYFDRFEKTSVGTIALSAAIIGATIVAIAGVSIPLALTITNREEDLDYNSNKQVQGNKKHAGYNKKQKPSDITPQFEYFFGIERSRYIENDRTYFASFLAEIARGGQIFFNLNGNALSLLGSFGYYVNFCRSIIRDTFRITELFTPKNLEGQSVEFPDNIVSYDTLQIVKNSKVIKAINLFVKLADIEKSISKNEDATGTGFINNNDNLENSVKTFNLQSVYRNHLNLNNLEVIHSGSFVDSFTHFVIKEDKRSYLDELRRDLKEEYILNTDYLPFYFKDLRTNKIVSFYATMNDFSETYSPQWVEESYYGRIDPIKFYKSTTRKVSISFKVFASNQDDYVAMWNKLQDLVSLVYPKYTDKRKVTFNKKQVEIPYSQSYSQQPLIRVKIGELITNNISNNLKLTYDKILKINDLPAGNQQTTNENSSAQPPSPNQEKVSIGATVPPKEEKTQTSGLLLTEEQITKNKNKLDHIKKYMNNSSNFNLIVKTDLTKESLSADESSYARGQRERTKSDQLYEDKAAFEGRLTESMFYRMMQLDYENNELIHYNNPDAKKQLENLIKTGNLIYSGQITGFKSQDSSFNTQITNQRIPSGSELKNIVYFRGITFISIKSNMSVFNSTNKKNIKSEYNNIWIISLSGLNYVPPKPAVPKTPPVSQDNVSLNASAPPSDASIINNTNQQQVNFEENPFYKAILKSYGLGALAYIDNLSYKTQEGYPWELDKKEGRRPKIIDVSMELTILHDIQPFSDEKYKHYQGLDDNLIIATKTRGQ